MQNPGSPTGLDFDLDLSEVSFQWKNPDFLFRNPEFLIRNSDFLLKHVDFIIKQADRIEITAHILSLEKPRGEFSM